MKNKIVLLLLAVTLMGSVPLTAYAVTWTKDASTNRVTLPFTVEEEGIIFPRPVVVEGEWQEKWDGTQGGWATLNRLYHCAVIHNWDPIAMDFIDEFWPEANYNDGQTDNWWSIVYPYQWIWQVSYKQYKQGYNNPGTYYYNPDVTGYVRVWAPDTNQIYLWSSWDWVQ